MRTLSSRALRCRRRVSVILGLLLAICAGFGQVAAVDGQQAMEHVRQLVQLGPRPSGSKQIEAARQYILRVLRSNGLKGARQEFSASVPGGEMPMTNLIVRIEGSAPSPRPIVLLTGHYDTKRFLDRNFVGANDGGSSAAILLELARVLVRSRPRHDVWVVFFDGEEAIGFWSDTDSLYGSRHLARQMRGTEELQRVRALINLDMIGDRDLQLVDEYYSAPALRELLRESAAAVGVPSLVGDGLMAVEDDHLPFVRLGVPAVNLIDFNYGPANRYWHTAEDSVDKLAPSSFETMGRLVLHMLKKLGALEN